ncbi:MULTISPECIES: LysE/ArgO family amino acid transporter [Arthrobacter]|uniref:LysE family transporter n=1 Tax=Arthrobacter humicola TaxID=409291 RepID=A0ABN2YFE1_9MICC|nr:LysE/ArgO family amino acid transporter [Arthrobacter sp. H-02-3]PVZ60358.1 amino acid transporter [Arthrobacter sp. H-02-3]
MILPLFSGLSAGLSLIVAIGAQNAFVLRQGIQRSHVAMVVAVCAASDLVLILLGVAGIGVLLDRAPAALVVIRWAGAAFLFAYGALAARRAVRGEQMDHSGDRPGGARGAVLGTCLAFTWLNPHVYLDTVLLLGSLAAAHGESGRWWFAAGAGLGSIAWFTALGAGARFLAPVFRRRAAWRVLDAGIAVVMITLAVLLLS